METTSTSASSPCIAQLEAYKDLHRPTVDKFYDITALARSALSLLDQIETQQVAPPKDAVDDINAARRILFMLEIMSDKASEEIDESFCDIARGMNHGQN